MWVVMAVTVSTVLGPGLTASNQAAGAGGYCVARLSPSRSDQIRSLQYFSYLLRSLQGVRDEEASPRFCPGIFLVFQSRSLGSRVKPVELERRRRGERKVESRGEQVQMARGKYQMGRAEYRIKHIRREAKCARQNQNPPSWIMIPPTGESLGTGQTDRPFDYLSRLYRLG